MAITEQEAEKSLKKQYGNHIKDEFFSQSYLDIYNIMNSEIAMIEIDIPGYDTKMIPSFLVDTYYNRSNYVVDPSQGKYTRSIEPRDIDIFSRLHPLSFDLYFNSVTFDNYLATPVNTILFMGSKIFVKYIRDIADYYEYSNTTFRRPDPAADEMVQQMAINIEIVIRDFMALILHRIIPYNEDTLDGLNSILEIFNLDFFDLQYNYAQISDYERFATILPFLSSILASELKYNQNKAPLRWIKRNYPQAVQYISEAIRLI